MATNPRRKSDAARRANQHMHIESSMMTPLSMAGRLAQCGVTTIVSEPHEMANVNGTQGILDMMKAGENAPIDIFYGIPSCVPATDPSLETTGGIMRMEDMKKLLDNPNVACIGEIMNYTRSSVKIIWRSVSF